MNESLAGGKPGQSLCAVGGGWFNRDPTAVPPRLLVQLREPTARAEFPQLCPHPRYSNFRPQDAEKKRKRKTNGREKDRHEAYLRIVCRRYGNTRVSIPIRGKMPLTTGRSKTTKRGGSRAPSSRRPGKQQTVHKKRDNNIMPMSYQNTRRIPELPCPKCRVFPAVTSPPKHILKWPERLSKVVIDRHRKADCMFFFLFCV